MSPSFKYTYLILVVSAISFLVSCNSSLEQKIDKKEYQLVWSDDFSGAAGQLPDATKWTYDLGNNNGWGNQELQTYTNNPANVSLDGNGNLVLTALRNGANYTSARIKTQNLFSQAYGKFEARLITPYGTGLWPAFWLLGANSNTVIWPQCGEIDIMELRGQLPSTANCAIHGPGYSAGNALSGSYTLFNSRYDVDYHIFAVEWTENQIDFYIDNYLYRRIQKSDVPGQWVYDHPFFMILNIAVGGNYLGNPNSQTPFPQKMIIDYVKVYQ